jgi:hypothetical protein
MEWFRLTMHESIVIIFKFGVFEGLFKGWRLNDCCLVQNAIKDRRRFEVYENAIFMYGFVLS